MYRRFFWVVVALFCLCTAWPLVAAPSRGKARKPPLPSRLLCVVCEHYDRVLVYRADARGRLAMLSHGIGVQAPRDAVYNPLYRRLYVSADYMSRPCIVTYALDAHNHFHRVGDPVPTAVEGPQLVLAGYRLYAWSPRGTQMFTLDSTGQPTGLPQSAVGKGVDALVLGRANRVAYVLSRGKVGVRRIDPGTGALGSALGMDVDPGYGTSGIELDPSGRHLYVLLLGGADQHVRIFDVRPDGSLVPSDAATSATTDEAQKRMFFDGPCVYVTNVSDTISIFLDNEGTGHLTRLYRPVPTAHGVDGLVFFSRWAYAVGADDHSIWVYRVDPRHHRLHRVRQVWLPDGVAGTRIMWLGGSRSADARESTGASSTARPQAGSRPGHRLTPGVLPTPAD